MNLQKVLQYTWLCPSFLCCSSLWAAVGGGSGDPGSGHVLHAVPLHAGSPPHRPSALLPAGPQVQHQKHPFKHCGSHVSVWAGLSAGGQSHWTTGKHEWLWVMIAYHVSVAIFACDDLNCSCIIWENSSSFSTVCIFHGVKIHCSVPSEYSIISTFPASFFPILLIRLHHRSVFLHVCTLPRVLGAGWCAHSAWNPIN